jgi:hypothetical protein
MNPSLPINDPCQTDPCWLAARHAQARIYSLLAQPAPPIITPVNRQRARGRQLAHPSCATKQSLHTPRPGLASPTPVSKSP